MQRVHIFLSGFIQGVGFRMFVKRNARKLELTGWVRNLPDGRVEIVAEGERKNLIKLIELTKEGPFLAMVTKVDVSWEKAKGEFNSFEIIR